MCFSTTASFASGVVLSAVGISCLTKVRASNQILFASIPLVFGIQQLLEGVVWLSLSNSKYAQFQSSAPYAFLLIAQIVWPILIPYAHLLMEQDKKRRKMLQWLTGVGTLIVAFLLYFVFSQSVTAEIREHHIHYSTGISGYLAKYGPIPYIIVIVSAPFISTVERMKWLAWSTLTAFLISKIFFDQYLISVWCFFAAVVSVTIWLVIDRSEQKFIKNQVSSNTEWTNLKNYY
jgi:hypothetical protein